MSTNANINATIQEILRTLGRIEGELLEIRKLSGRINRVEIWVAWLRGGWAALVAGYVYLVRSAIGK